MHIYVLFCSCGSACITWIEVSTLSQPLFPTPSQMTCARPCTRELYQIPVSVVMCDKPFPPPLWENSTYKNCLPVKLALVEEGRKIELCKKAAYLTTKALIKHLIRTGCRFLGDPQEDSLRKSLAVPSPAAGRNGSLVLPSVVQVGSQIAHLNDGKKQPSLLSCLALFHLVSVKTGPLSHSLQGKCSGTQGRSQEFLLGGVEGG